MAVYERTYKRYVGDLTPTWSRFLVLPKYAFPEVFKSRFLVAFLVLSSVPTLLGLIVIYGAHYQPILDFISAVGGDATEWLDVNATVVRRYLDIQAVFAFLLTLFVGPALISKDFANNGLPLYLSRPFSRAEYVVGKLTVLVVLLSAVTWMPGLLLYLMQGVMAKGGWLWSHLRLAFGIFVGSWVLIAVLSLMILAFSALARWKSVTAFMMLFAVFGGKFFSALVNNLFKTDKGELLDLERLINGLWVGLLGGEGFAGPGPVASLMMLGLVAGCCLWILNRRIRAYEVVS